MLCKDDILYEDNHLFVAYKRSGLLTQPTDLESESLQSEASAWIKEVYQKPFNVFLFPIHRLDKPASGIVVFAKTSKALSRLNQYMREGRFHKTYRVKVSSPLEKPQGKLIHYLAHDDYRARVTSKDEKGAKRAELDYQCLADGSVEVKLITGRYHQIRAQFSHIGSPICGDRKYGSRDILPDGKILLCHSHCVFPHPVGEREISIGLLAEKF